MILKHIVLVFIYAILVFTMIVPTVSYSIEQDFDAEEEQADRIREIYASPEQRREARLGTQLTPWLKVSGLVEIEQAKQKLTLVDEEGLKFTVSDNEPMLKNIQIAMNFSFTEILAAEIIVELEKQGSTKSKFDEALLSWEYDDFSIAFGQQNLPFGEYYSHFVVGPNVEFGETRRKSVVIDYTISEQFEVTGFIFDNKIKTLNFGSNFDWGLAFEWKNHDESFVTSLSYISDITESDEGFLTDHFSEELISYSISDVAAINGNLMFGYDNFEITAEFIRCLDKFKEFSSETDQPESTNLELAYFFTGDFQLAFRIEKSAELAETPDKQYGMSLVWLPVEHLIMSLEYLKGDFKHTPTEDEQITDNHTVAWQVSVEF